MNGEKIKELVFGAPIAKKYFNLVCLSTNGNNFLTGFWVLYSNTITFALKS